jgi:hypothetical protein
LNTSIFIVLANALSDTSAGNWLRAFVAQCFDGGIQTYCTDAALLSNFSDRKFFCSAHWISDK